MQFDNDILVLHTDDPICTAVTVRRAEQGKVSVILSGPISPRPPETSMSKHRIYIDLVDAQRCRNLIELAGLACSLSQEWLVRQVSQHWYWEVATACKPLQARCNTLLVAIASVCRNRWGARYWEHPEARDLLRRELSLMGVPLPPQTPCTLFYTAVDGTVGSAHEEAHR
jgi:hypothetical protein